MKTDLSWDDDQASFEYQYNIDNKEFFARLGPVDFRDKHVAEIGCGHGALCIDIAQRGARQVLGLDIYDRLINFATSNLQNYPDLADKVSYSNCMFEDVAQKFDVIISKDTFEHVSDLKGLMADIKSKLNDGGMLVVGFSPLYFSPNGDHHRFLEKYSFPWVPVIFPEYLLLKIASSIKNRKITAVNDLGLNKITPKQFRKILHDQGWKIIRIKYNCGNKTSLGLMSIFRKIPFLEKYFTVSIYTVLQRA